MEAFAKYVLSVLPKTSGKPEVRDIFKRAINDEQAEEIVRRYSGGELAASIAEDFCLSECSIYRYLRAAGIRKRYRTEYSKEKREEFQKLLSEMTATEAARKLMIPESTARAWRRGQ